MKILVVAALAALCATFSVSTPVKPDQTGAALERRSSCENTATSRNCWGEYDTDTNYYDVTPDTGATREYWLSVVNTTFAPDGYQRGGLTFNGSFPGPEISADWGDNLIIHVTNDLAHNGTSVHWHGIRQLNSSQYDGVPGITQCPIAPGETMTYKFQATQYGTTWYHSHFSVQYGNGLLGPLVIRGPATANYDEDLGSLFLSDWGHTDAFTLWQRVARFNGAPPTLENGIINGTNVFNCTGSSDVACLGTGRRFEMTFVPGTKYLIRLINSATEGYIRFAIDNHNFQVISNDLVPLVPFVTDNLMIAVGQRYDIIVEADQAVDNYWLRAIWQTPCSANDAADNILGIIRYNGSDIIEDPTSIKTNFTLGCGDQTPSDLVPYLKLDVGSSSTRETLILNSTTDSKNVFTWTFNSSSFYLDWADPTLLQIENGDTNFPTAYNVEPINVVDEWVYWVIQDRSNFGARPHPIHLHGHDFFVLAQESGIFNSSTVLNLANPPRRDVASLPGEGFMVIAFFTDNPGSWIMHCHLAWHQSQGLALQFVEREPEITSRIFDFDLLNNTCNSWNSYKEIQVYEQDDSGI